MPIEIIDIVNEISQITQRNCSFHIKKALELYIGNYADLQISLDRLQDSSDKTIDRTNAQQT